MGINENYINSTKEIRQEIRDLNNKLDDLSDINDKDWFTHKQIRGIRENIRGLKRKLRSELNDDSGDDDDSGGTDFNQQGNDFDEQININLEVITCSSAAFFICIMLLIIPYIVYDFNLIDRTTMIYLQILIVVIFIILSIVVCHLDRLYNIKYN